MTVAKRIDGKARAAELAESITRDTASLLDEHGIKPGLAVVIIGEDPASQVYVRNKKRTAESCGFHSVRHMLAEEASQSEIIHGSEVATAIVLREPSWKDHVVLLALWPKQAWLNRPRPIRALRSFWDFLGGLDQRAYNRLDGWGQRVASWYARKYGGDL